LNKDVPLGPNLNGAIIVVKIYARDFGYYPNLNKTLIIHPDISERTKILMKLFYTAHL